MEFDVLGMISKDLGSGGKRLPTVGYQLTSQDADLLEHVLSVGYRHFMFEPCYTQVLADTLQEYAGDEDIFLTLRIPVHTGKFTGAQQIAVKALAMLGLDTIDMVLLYDNKRGGQNVDQTPIWQARWKEMESLHLQGITRNIGLYSEEAGVAQLLHTTSKHPPAVVFIPTGPGHKANFSQRAEVVKVCKKLNCQAGVALDVDTEDTQKGSSGQAKLLCRSVVEDGFSFVVSSEDENRIIETSEVFDHPVKSYRQKQEVMTSLGLKL